MHYPAILVFKSYQPLILKKGMLFITTMTTVTQSRMSIWELEKIPRDEQQFIAQNGYPVKPYICDTVTGETLGYPEQIGWINSNGKIVNIDTNLLSYIFTERKGDLLIDIEEKGENITPVIREGKVVLKLT